MRTNKEIRKAVNENYKPIRFKIALYALVYLLIPCAVTFIPVIGPLICAIMASVCAVGFMATVINVYNGKGDEESPISYLKHTAKLFTNWFCASLWVTLKCWVGIILDVIGYVLLVVGGFGTIMSFLTADAGKVTSNAGLFILGWLLTIIGGIIILIISLKHAAVNYEIIHDNKSGKRARDIVNSAREHLSGHIWQWVCMLIYYTFYFIGILIIMSLIGSLIAQCTGVDLDHLESSPIMLAVALLYYAWFFFCLLPKMICSYEEFYKDLVGGVEETPTTAPSEAPTDTPIE